MDLFATRYNCKLPWSVSPVPDPKAWAVDALSLSWENLDLYAFSPIPLLTNVVTKALGHQCRGMIIIDSPMPNKLTRYPDPTIQRQPTQGSAVPESSRLAPRAKAIRKQGFSDQVATKIAARQRQSTRFVYEAKWSVFV